jgi:hypothetical protein
MIRLRDVLQENTENRINLMKLEVLMEKMLPALTKTQNTKLTQLCTELHEMVNAFNMLPYTIYNRIEWPVLQITLMTKLMELKTEAEKMVDSNNVDVKPFIKALDELIAS